MALDIQNQAAANDGDTYAFLPVWRRMSLQLVLLAGISLVAVLIGEFLQPSFSRELGWFLAHLFVFSPLLFWLLFSVLPEYSVARPRRRLMGVAMVSALTASAIGLPLVEEFFQVELWLPLESVSQRIIGFTLTAGVVDVGLKFLVLRYLIYPQALRVRSDAIAYAFASAIGYSFFLNLALLWSLQPIWDLAAIYILANFTIQFGSSMYIALGMIESYFSDAFPLVLPINLLLAALMTGLITALLGGLLSGPLGLSGNTDRPFFALLMLFAMLFGTLGIVYFLYSNSERREREAYGAQ